MSFTPDPTLQAIKLVDYDMVVAVTQVSINETMGEYLSNQSQSFVILGTTDDDGNVTGLTTDPKLSTCSLSATLALEKDPDTKKYINLVNLSTTKGNQTLEYNVTMQNGDFKYNAAGVNIEVKQSKDPWIFRMFVDLSLQGVSKKSLPKDLQQELADIDENVFSIQQLYMDLNNASLDKIDGGKFPSLVQTPAMQLLALYLAQQQANNAPLFGVTVSLSDKTVPVPTLTPTFVDFCITPYTDSNGNNSNPDLDTLNYLVMVDQNTPPKTPPQSFSFNWVTDEQIDGVMAIREDVFTPTVITELNPLLTTLSPVMYCKADGTKGAPDDVVIQLNAGSSHAFNSSFNPSTGQIASNTYNTSDSDTDNGPWYANYSLTVSGNYTTNTNLFLTSNTILLSGTIAASAYTYTYFPSSEGGTTSEVDMPLTTYSWSVELELYFDAQNNGQLDLNIINKNFDSDPVVSNHDQSWWQKFLNGLSGFMQSYTSDLGDLRGSVSTNVEGNIVTSLTAILSNTNHFIFPGAKTFAFKNPQFSNTKDMVSNINYLNPNA